jgi:hypothetical protein
MKTRMIILFVLVVTSCRKEKQEITFGSVSALLNGNPWQTKWLGAVINDNCNKGSLNFNFNIVNSQGFQREKLSFTNIILKTNSFKIYPPDYANPSCNDSVSRAAYYTLVDDGMVLKDTYIADGSAANFFTIDKYNAGTKEVWGKFAVTFVILNSRPGSPDTIRFTNGSYHTKILR